MTSTRFARRQTDPVPRGTVNRPGQARGRIAPDDRAACKHTRAKLRTEARQVAP